MDTVFPFMVVFIDGVVSFIDDAKLKLVHTMYSDGINKMLYCETSLRNTKLVKATIESRISQLKLPSKNLSADFGDVNLFTLKYQVLAHVVKDMSRFGDVWILDLSPFEHFNNTINKFLKMQSLRQFSTLEKAV